MKARTLSCRTLLLVSTGAVLALALLAGCQSGSPVRVDAEPLPDAGAQTAQPVAAGNYAGLKFSHQQHVTELELECSTCHAIEGAAPAMPDHETCGACHEITMDEPSVDQCMLCHAVPGVAEPSEDHLSEIGVARERPAGFADVKFDHSRVGGEAGACNVCHAKARSAAEVGAPVLPTMADTVKGFEAMGGSGSDCSACHANLAKDVAPGSHTPEWQRLHGMNRGMIASGQCDLCHRPDQCRSCHTSTPPQSHTSAGWMRVHGRQYHAIESGDCLVCHQEDACHQCHQIRPPSDHTHFWRLRSHGQEAAMNRDRCRVCHKEDFCMNCHLGTASVIPRLRFHHPDADCLLCHGPSSTVRPNRTHGAMPLDSCLKCHRFEQ